MALYALVSKTSSFGGLSFSRVTRAHKNRFEFRLFSTMKTTEKPLQSKGRLESPPQKLLIHWRGEDVEGYSLEFRHPEFLGALSAVTNISFDGQNNSPIHFENALEYDGEAPMAEVKRIAFNQALQWLTFSDPSSGLDKSKFSLNALIAAASRCSLIHTVYEVVAEGTEYSELNDKAIENGGFQDCLRGGENEHHTWAVRVRHFGDKAGSKKEKRHSGKRTRSVNMEQEALLALKPMLLEFGGGVDLKNPDCKIYVFDGLMGKKVLARKIASGPPVSVRAACFFDVCLLVTST